MVLFLLFLLALPVMGAPRVDYVVPPYGPSGGGTPVVVVGEGFEPGATVEIGGVMELFSSDASTNKDVPRWAQKRGHDYLGTIEDAGFWRIFVKRGK